VVSPCVWFMKVANPDRPRTRQKIKLEETEMWVTKVNRVRDRFRSEA